MNVPVVDSNIKANRETTRLSICPENASRQEISITDITVRMDREDPGTPAKNNKNAQLTHSRVVFSKFPDISLTFDHFPDPFERTNFQQFFFHQQFENFVQIFLLADLIFKRESQFF